MTVQSGERFRKKLEEQVQFLERSCKLFDHGHENEAIRLATSLRVLFHDTRNSVSLLTHLGLKLEKMLSSSRGHGDWRDYLAHEIDHSSSRPVIVRPLLGETLSLRSMEEWWGQEAVFVYKGTAVSRSKVILSAANRDGGAHVDRRLEAYYEFLCAGKWAIGITGDLEYADTPPFPQGITVFPKNANLALIRQFAHETIRTVERHGWLSE